MLGLAPDAFANRLRIVRPLMPGSAGTLSLRGLRVGRAVVDLGFERRDDASAEVRVLRNEGSLDVQVEPDGTEMD
jgi:hypothetical protein